MLCKELEITIDGEKKIRQFWKYTIERLTNGKEYYISLY